MDTQGTPAPELKDEDIETSDQNADPGAAQANGGHESAHAAGDNRGTPETVEEQGAETPAAEASTEVNSADAAAEHPTTETADETPAEPVGALEGPDVDPILAHGEGVDSRTESNAGEPPLAAAEATGPDVAPEQAHEEEVAGELEAEENAPIMAMGPEGCGEDSPTSGEAQAVEAEPAQQASEESADSQDDINSQPQVDGESETGADAADESEATDEITSDIPTISAEELIAEQSQPAQADDTEETRKLAILEAIVYVTDEPLTLQQIANALGEPPEAVKPLLDQLAAEFAKPHHGLTVKEVAGGYKMATKPEHHEAVRSFVKNLNPPLKLSMAALETLAVIAYKQPITGPEIMDIRGVQGAGVLKTLLDRKLIATAGRKQVVGKPMLYKTTKEFLVQFGLRDLNELPTLKEFEELRRMAFSEEELPLQGGAPEAPTAAVDGTPAAESVPASETASAESAAAKPAAQDATKTEPDAAAPADESAPAESDTTVDNESSNDAPVQASESTESESPDPEPTEVGEG